MDYEKLGLFYLGREVDPETGELEAAPLLYDSRDLTTHALCVGMTGSGKTGLCVGLLEEAAIDGVPALILDPKGDLGNLLLTFPELDGESFLPWIDPDAARRKELSPEAYAGTQAVLWKKGLADWDQGPDRIRRLREAADFSIYTPGSSAGLGLSILSSFHAPPDSIRRDGDLLRERVATTATSILNLLGVDADPVQSREHILVSNLLENAWSTGRDLGLADLVREIQSPPFSRVGVFELESFFPADKRMTLALQLNNLLASPSFSSWLEGESMDIDRLLFTSEGKPRISIVSIAHLSDSERMFFVSLLLTQLLGWVRTQSGTSSLRAIFYMDEIFGYFPPVANPPSKAPLLTLLKQARAFGLGIVLATQNPVDLDYKGLSNIGTWFLGRLQTERDKARILDGLQSASGSHQKGLSRAELERTISGLAKRNFLLHNVHDDRPELFHTRWVLSYLRGPLTRDQIRRLMADRPRLSEKSSGTPSTAPRDRDSKASQIRPVLPKSVDERFVPVRSSQPEGAELLDRPTLLAAGNIYTASARYDVATREGLAFTFPLASGQPDWSEPAALEVDLDELETYPETEDAAFSDLPSAAAKAASYRSWRTAYRSRIYQEKRIELLRSPELKLVSEPGESERDFKVRLRQTIREKKDLEKAKLRKKFETKFRSLEERARKTEQRIDREKDQASQQKLQTAISFGASLLGAVLGGRRSTRGATTAFRGIGRSFKESGDVQRAEQDLEAAIEAIEELKASFELDAEILGEKLDALIDEIEKVRIRPKKADINIDTTALLWIPWWRHESGELQKT